MNVCKGKWVEFITYSQGTAVVFKHGLRKTVQKMPSSTAM